MLRSFLRLPEDVHIIGLRVGDPMDFEDDTCYVKIKGTNKGIPETKEGEATPFIRLDQLSNY